MPGFAELQNLATELARTPAAWRLPNPSPHSKRLSCTDTAARAHPILSIPKLLLASYIYCGGGGRGVISTS